MGRMSLQYILDHADELADRFEQMDPETVELKPVEPLRQLSRAAGARVHAEAQLAETVELCRSEGLSWAEIGSVIGVSAQAAQQRYGKVKAGK